MEGYIFSFKLEDKTGIIYGTNGSSYLFTEKDVNNPAAIAIQAKVDFSPFVDGRGRNTARLVKINQHTFQANGKSFSASETVGNSYAGVGSSNNYADQVVFHGERGHGFAAEQANHLHDKFTGKEAHLVGGNNAKNGADRLVNDVYIQTKYCKTGSKCISECFENDTFKYMQGDIPMQIEVPADKYESALQAMEERIRKGQVPGISDPTKASDIVRKGSFTYEQAKNIAKFGTIDSLKFDATKGIEFSVKSMGISTAISFAINIWNGEKFNVALENSIKDGFKVFGTAFATNILTSQIGRTGIEKSLRPITDPLVKKVGPKAAAKIAYGLSNKAIYGAAALNHVSKLLRGNIVTNVITTTILSSADISRAIRGKMSGPQLFKNITNTTAGVVGGAAGWSAGASAGATAGAAVGSVIPGLGTAIGASIGTIVGGLTGSLVGGGASAKATSTILDKFIKDDAPKMLEIFNSVFEKLAIDYLLSEKEISLVCDQIKDNLNMAKELREMYSSQVKASYAKGLIKPVIEEIVARRPKITLPNDEEIIQEIAHLIEMSSSEINEQELDYHIVACTNCGTNNRIRLDSLEESQNHNIKCGKCGTHFDNSKLTESLFA
ncbi:MAG: hypothetical protein K0Q87_4555 [Neobacillus sp.]|nr:hypothetical protein [Neobacillus sp.]